MILDYILAKFVVFINKHIFIYTFNKSILVFKYINTT